MENIQKHITLTINENGRRREVPSLSKVIARLRNEGFATTLKHALCNISNAYYERRMRLYTTQTIYPKDLGHSNPDSSEYVPTEFRGFQNIMSKVEIKNDDVFLDYGSGMGRVLIMAAMYPFRRVIGVELSSELNAITTQNIEKSKKFLKCKQIEIHESDATAYPLPRDVTFIYFFHPFKGTTLSKVLDIIEQSLDCFPRLITIIFKNPVEFEAQASTRNWLKKRGDYKPLYGHRYVIYETAAKQIV